MGKLTLCQFCKINWVYTASCQKCHMMYWEVAKSLTSEQNHQIQMALSKKDPLPDWFENWWNKINELKVFL